MTDQSLPPNLVDKIADIERRLSVLETARRLTSSSIQDGSLRILDASGNVIVELGELPDGREGIRINDSAGNRIVQMGECPNWDDDATSSGLVVFKAGGTAAQRVLDVRQDVGMGWPWTPPFSWRDPAVADDHATGATGAYETAWIGHSTGVADALFGIFVVNIGTASAAADIRFRLDGLYTSNVISFAAGSSRTETVYIGLDLLEDTTHTVGQPLLFVLEVNQTAGSAGAVGVFPPQLGPATAGIDYVGDNYSSPVAAGGLSQTSP